MKKSSCSCCVLDGATTNPGDLSWEPLEKLVASLTVYDRTAPSELVERAGSAGILITNKVVLGQKELDALPHCQAVFLLSTGTNVVDLEACTARSIPVCNIPSYSTDSVAELVIAYLLHWARGVEVHARSVRAGTWAACPDFYYQQTPQRELAGRTLGLVGFGHIAQAVARIARALKLRVLVFTPHPEGKPDLGQTFVSLETLYRESDFLSLHCPLTGRTEGLIRKTSLESMKPGAVLINTGRGGLIHEPDLLNHLQSGKLDAVYLDVFSSEPPPGDHLLTPETAVNITPHLAWATHAARQRLLNELVANVAAWSQGKPRNVVNAI